MTAILCVPAPRAPRGPVACSSYRPRPHGPLNLSFFVHFVNHPACSCSGTSASASPPPRGDPTCSCSGPRVVILFHFSLLELIYILPHGLAGLAFRLRLQTPLASSKPVHLKETICGLNLFGTPRLISSTRFELVCTFVFKSQPFPQLAWLSDLLGLRTSRFRSSSASASFALRELSALLGLRAATSRSLRLRSPRHLAGHPA